MINKKTALIALGMGDPQTPSEKAAQAVMSVMRAPE